MTEEKPFIINNLSKEQLNELFNHYIKIRSGFLPHSTKTSHTHPPERVPKKPILSMVGEDF